MKQLVFLLALSFSSLSIAQHYVEPSFKSPFNRSEGRLQKQLLYPAKDLKVAEIVNITKQYGVESYWTINLLEWMINTGEYSTIYIDTPFLYAMVYDNYIKDKRWMKVDTLNVFSQSLDIDEIDGINFLNWLREYNRTHDKKVSLCGLDFKHTDAAILGIKAIYPSTEGIIDSIFKMTWDKEADRDVVVKNTIKRMIDKEDIIRRELGDDYDVLLYYFQVVNHKEIISHQKLDSLMYENFVNLQQKRKDDARSIVFMRYLSLRKLIGITTFRSLLENQMQNKEYTYYNLIDDID